MDAPKGKEEKKEEQTRSGQTDPRQTHYRQIGSRYSLFVTMD